MSNVVESSLRRSRAAETSASFFRSRSRGGLIKDDNRGPTDGCTRDRDALALATGQSGAPFAKHRVVMLRHSGNEVMSIRNLRGLNDFLRSSGRLAQSNVVPHPQGVYEGVGEVKRHE